MHRAKSTFSFFVYLSSSLLSFFEGGLICERISRITYTNVTASILNSYVICAIQINVNFEISYPH